MDAKTLARFWKKVDKDGPIPPHRPELGPCWVWTGKRNDAGYGVLNIDKRGHRAHRVSWGLVNGDANDLCVLHGCDNRACVRPDHLFLGTHQDNVADMRAKRRAVDPPVHVGAANNRTRLTAEQVLAIREHYAAGMSQTELAQRYSICQAKISDIVLCRVWRHLPGAAPQVRAHEDRANVKLTAEKVREMRAQYRAGATVKALAAKFGMCVNATRNALTGKTWQDVA